MAAQQFGVARERAAPYPLFPAPRCACIDPLLCPLRQRDLFGRNVLAGIARADQATELCPRVLERAVERLAEALAFDAVAQPECVGPALVNAAVTVVASLAHLTASDCFAS